MARSFSRKARNAVELVSGSTGSHADHIVPYSKQGETSVENCQLINADANQKKGAFHFKPLRWQNEFLRAWENRTPNVPFMLIAIPGGGKTWASLEACRRWMAAGADRRIIVVVPTDNLREQWRDEASKFGISLQTKEFGSNFKHGFQGGVVSYSLAASQSLLFRRLCSVSPTMVLFDEVHHCGDEAAYGEGIKASFTLAKEKLLMSGTPWKTDGSVIPFVKYDANGYAVGDYSYDYPRALNEDVVRYLVFVAERGAIKNDTTGIEEILSKDVSEKDAQRRLRRILDARGHYVKQLILKSHEKLMECRKSIPDAGALAACIDGPHAEMVADTIRTVTGCEPSIIVSDSDLANDTVKEFRKSKREWLVAIRQVSEGTDIKRLQVLCYLTNTTTELFFRQLVGRVSRIRRMEDYEGYVYMPADPRLIQCARNIENAQVQAIREQNERDAKEIEREQTTFDFDSYSTEHHGTDLWVVSNESVSPEDAQKYEQISSATKVPVNQVMKIIAMSQSHRFSQQEPMTTERSQEEIMDELRRECSKKVAYLSILTGQQHWEIHGRFKEQKLMSLNELRAKRAALVRAIKEAKQ